MKETARKGLKATPISSWLSDFLVYTLLAVKPLFKKKYTTLWNIWTYQLLCKKDYTTCVKFYTTCVIFLTKQLVYRFIWFTVLCNFLNSSLTVYNIHIDVYQTMSGSTVCLCVSVKSTWYLCINCRTKWITLIIYISEVAKLSLPKIFLLPVFSLNFLQRNRNISIRDVVPYPPGTSFL